MTTAQHRTKNNQPHAALAPPGLDEFSRILSTTLSPDSVHDIQQPAPPCPAVENQSQVID